jgi:hypothetical protein
MARYTGKRHAARMDGHDAPPDDDAAEHPDSRDIAPSSHPAASAAADPESKEHPDPDAELDDGWVQA